MLAEYYQYFKELVVCKTVSWLPSSSEETEKLIRWIEQKCISFGMKVSISEHQQPIIVAEYFHNPSLPTIVLYSRYDVIAADPTQGRKYDPFFLYIARDSIIARGASDAKWQFLIALMTIRELIQKNELAYNIIFVVEWEKHIYSPHLSEVLSDLTTRYAIDFSLIVWWNGHAYTPTIYTWCRGWFDTHIKIQTSSNQFDSAYFTGIAPNAYYVAMRLLSKLYDTSHRVTIPYFYYDVQDIHVNDLVNHKNITFNQEQFFEKNAIKELMHDKKYDVFSNISMRPNVQIANIYAKSMPWSIANEIDIILTWRLVPNQQVKNILQSFEQRLQHNLSDVTISNYKVSSTVEPVKDDLHGKISQKAKNSLANIYDQDPLMSYCPDAYQHMSYFLKEHSIPTIAVPFADIDSNIAWVNENITIDAVEKSFSFYKQFLRS